MTDEELIKHLRIGPEIVYRYVNVDHAAADRIEKLVQERDAMLRVVTDNHVALQRAEAAEAKLTKATDALKELIFLSNEGDIVDWLNALARAQELMAEIKGE